MATARQDERRTLPEPTVEDRWTEYFNESIQRGALLERLKTGLSILALREWRKYRVQIIDAARGFESIRATGQRGVNLPRVGRIIERMRGLASEGVAAARGALVPELIDLAKSELRWVEGRMERLFPRVSLERYDARTIGRIVKSHVFGGGAQAQTLDQWFKGIDANAQRLIETTVKAGVIGGERAPDIVRRLRRTQGGILNRIGHDIEAIAHTTTSAISQQVHNEATQAIRDVDSRMEIWSATLDLVTCVTCASLSGQQWRRGTGPYPIAHPRCRCRRLLVPLGLDLSKITRATRDGPMRADMSFSDWLKMQARADQDRVLGKGRAKLWRAGKLNDLDPRTVLDANYRPIAVRDLDRL